MLALFHMGFWLYVLAGAVLLLSFGGALLGAYLGLYRKSFVTHAELSSIKMSTQAVQESLARTSVSQVIAWRPEDWLTYYGGCREFLLALGAKFVALMTQASVYSSAACAAMLALHREFSADKGIPREIYVILAMPLMLPLLVYWYFLVRYFYQTRETGSVMKEVEDNFPMVEANLRLLTRLRRVPAARLYGSRLTIWLVWIYPPLRAFAILAFSYCLSYGVPEWVLPSRPNPRFERTGGQPIRHAGASLATCFSSFNRYGEA